MSRPEPEPSLEQIAEDAAAWDRLEAVNPDLAARLREPIDRTKLRPRPRRPDRGAPVT